MVGVAKKALAEAAGVAAGGLAMWTASSASSGTTIALTMTTEEVALAFTILTTLVGVVVWSVRTAGRVSSQEKEISRMRVELGREIRVLRESTNDNIERIEANFSQGQTRVENTLNTLIKLAMNARASMNNPNLPE